MPRRLHPPTLTQWGCQHDWQVRHTKRLPSPWPAKHRNYRCRQCSLAMVTEEPPAVLWEDRALVELVNTLLPLAHPVYLRDQGITTLPLYGLNALLKKQGFYIYPLVLVLGWGVGQWSSLRPTAAVLGLAPM